MIDDYGLVWGAQTRTVSVTQTVNRTELYLSAEEARTVIAQHFQQLYCFPPGAEIEVTFLDLERGTDLARVRVSYAIEEKSE